MIREQQKKDWQALVDYLTTKGNGACLNALIEDGPDDVTNFAKLLSEFKDADNEKLAQSSHQ